METKIPKGWSMKQTGKPPFFEKEDGAFVLGRNKKRAERLVMSKLFRYGVKNKVFQNNVPSSLFAIRWSVE